MPTKEEILKKHEEADEWEDYNYPIFPAMEEYAKQEALEFNKYIFNYESNCTSFEQLYEVYQLSKLKK